MSPEWMASPERACLGQEALFLYPVGEKGRVHEERNKAAQAVCGQCPFMQACRDHARANREEFGVWGGETEDERRAYLRRQGSGTRKAGWDGTPCMGCGATLRVRTADRRHKEHLTDGEVFHYARGMCEACDRARARVEFTARWEITDLGVDMTLAELIAEARRGRLQDAARAQGVRIIGAYDALAWRIDTERQQLVVTGPAKVIETQGVAA